MTTLPPPDQPDRIRPHVYDGIQEFDKRLPNWWLFTLYATIVFAIGYWAYYEWLKAGPTPTQELVQAMTALEATRLAAAPALDDDSLWKMSRNPVFVAAGRTTFNTTCASCHQEKLTGAIGPNLVDRLWIHGGRPTDIYRTVDQGVLAKGMPAWGPVIGAKRSAEVTAYILSYHQEGEPVEVQESWTPRAPD